MRIRIAIIVALVAMSLASCGGRVAETVSAEGDTITSCSRLLTMVKTPSYIVADVADPWNSGNRLARYILVNRETLPDQSLLPEGVVVQVPLRSSLVYSSVHAGAIEELGRIESLTAVCDAEYYKLASVAGRLHSGEVVDMGSSMSPDIERLVEHSPEAILCSPFQNAGHGAIEQTGIPVIECADYMESSPLGRAEWIKFIGALYGESERADSIFGSVKREYEALARKVSTVSERPWVISEKVTDGVWYMPGGASYMARMFRDAGANYYWSDDTSTGSLQLDFATVYDRAHDADYWLIKTFGRDMTLEELETDYPLHARMKAFADGGVYVCNTGTTTFFEDFPFHPQLLLRDFIKIFHPGLLPDEDTSYYKPVR